MGRFAIIKKKEKRSFTAFGKVIQLLVLLLIIFIFVKTIHPFLAQNNSIDSKILVVEGFISDYALIESIQLFQNGGYDQMIITGKERMKGYYLDKYKNDGEFSAATLIKLGFDSTLLNVVAIKSDIQKDRTYATALNVKDWLISNNKQQHSINLVTVGCHARRSRYLFEKAFGKDYNIGIIAIKNQQYDQKKWWKSSHGFREVSKEFIAWIYARFFFFP